MRMDAENETCNSTIRIIIKSQMVRLLLNALQSVYVDAFLCSRFSALVLNPNRRRPFQALRYKKRKRKREAKNDSNKAIDV